MVDCECVGMSVVVVDVDVVMSSIVELLLAILNWCCCDDEFGR